MCVCEYKLTETAPAQDSGLYDHLTKKLKRFVQVGVEYGMITPGHELDDYLRDAVFDPSGFECVVAHNQQGVGKSNRVMQAAAKLARLRIRREMKENGGIGPPKEHEVWDRVLQSLVFTPSDFVKKLEQINLEEGERLDFIIWDDIQLEYTSSSFKTDVDQYAAIDSMFAVIRKKVAVVFITIPNISRLPKNVKDNVTFELYVGKNRRVQIRKIYRLPGQRRIESNLFKPIIQRSVSFNLFDIPPWAWERYEVMRRDITNIALANLKGATNMEDGEGYIRLIEAVKIVKDNDLKWGIQSLQQMASRKIIKKQLINGELCLELESLMGVIEAETYTGPLKHPIEIKKK